MADPGFPVGGGANFVGGHQLPMRLRFKKVCQKRIGTLGGPPAASPLDPPMENKGK